MNKYEYDVEKYPFVSLIQKLFNKTDLHNLHEISPEEDKFFDVVGADSATVFHDMFYTTMREGWLEFVETYESFIRNFIAPKYSESIIYQKWPTFRVHLPNNLAVAAWHTDSEFNHPEGEINYIIAITKMFESNTVITESEPNKKDFRQIELDPGEAFTFNGNKCTHGNLPNRTGKTRISLDFRIIKQSDYNASQNLSSMTTKTKFIIGEYYKTL